ncbi:MAG: ADP-heptose--LPS heptosyltransferase [Opitutae bacterium]|nr:ADP-heptose--LPS heptosyltransferase [Opitutae bacterium]
MKRPESLCILRLSALGDVTHVLPVVHTLQKHWPETRITWIIGRFAHKLVGDLPGVEFVVFDKNKHLRAYGEVRKGLAGRRFDVLLCMQVALRANLIIPLVSARRKIGFDRARAKDGHSLFIGESIPSRKGQHVVDAFFSFLETAGLPEKQLDWSVPIPESGEIFARRHIGSEGQVVIISPCASHPLRNWRAEYYGQVADHLQQKGLRVVLCGGPSEAEAAMGRQIEKSMRTDPFNLIGKDTLKDFLAMMKRAELLITPDSGPAHMANCVNLPVLGLYAASNPKRSGPYQSIDLCVDAYDRASRKFLKKPAAEIKWGKKIEFPGVMDLITPEMVMEKLDAILDSP